MSTVEGSLRAMLAQGERDGTLGPGAKLPPERDLVARWGVPRSEIRRAMAVIEREGLVVRHVGRGTFRAGSTAPMLPAAAQASADTTPAEIMQVRQMLEPQVAMLAARLATQADLDRISDCLAAGGAAVDAAEFEEWDTRLHRGIAIAAHNGLLMNLVDVMNSARALPIWGSLKRRTSTAALRACYHEEHTAIVDALRDRDPHGAAAAMRGHLQHVTDSLLSRPAELLRTARGPAVRPGPIRMR
jgi:DNA-binding FadR family transcriptional regulator